MCRVENRYHSQLEFMFLEHYFILLSLHSSSGRSFYHRRLQIYKKWLTLTCFLVAHWRQIGIWYQLTSIDLKYRNLLNQYCFPRNKILDINNNNKALFPNSYPLVGQWKSYKVNLIKNTRIKSITKFTSVRTRLVKTKIHSNWFTILQIICIVSTELHI